MSTPWPSGASVSARPRQRYQLGSCIDACLGSIPGRQHIALLRSFRICLLARGQCRCFNSFFPAAAGTRLDVCVLLVVIFPCFHYRSPSGPLQTEGCWFGPSFLKGTRFLVGSMLQCWRTEGYIGVLLVGLVKHRWCVFLWDPPNCVSVSQMVSL